MRRRSWARRRARSWSRARARRPRPASASPTASRSPSSWSDGSFRVTSAGSLPGGAPTPEAGARGATPRHRPAKLPRAPPPPLPRHAERRRAGPAHARPRPGAPRDAAHPHERRRLERDCPGRAPREHEARRRGLARRGLRLRASGRDLAIDIGRNRRAHRAGAGRVRPATGAGVRRPGAFDRRVLLTGSQTDAARPGAPARWSIELELRTSAPVRHRPLRVHADEAALTDEPFAYWSGVDAVQPLTSSEIYGAPALRLPRRHHPRRRRGAGRGRWAGCVRSERARGDRAGPPRLCAHRDRRRSPRHLPHVLPASPGRGARPRPADARRGRARREGGGRVLRP